MGQTDMVVQLLFRRKQTVTKLAGLLFARIIDLLVPLEVGECFKMCLANGAGIVVAGSNRFVRPNVLERLCFRRWRLGDRFGLRVIFHGHKLGRHLVHHHLRRRFKLGNDFRRGRRRWFRRNQNRFLRRDLFEFHSRFQNCCWQL